MYRLTEKFLMLFPFYRERVRVMDAYAIPTAAECREACG